MDWKPYYDAELRTATARDNLATWLRRAQTQMEQSRPYSPRTVLSFPHTALDYSGPLQARVASWLYGSGFKRVICLGVMHGALVPNYRIAVDGRAALADRESAFAQISGAFLSEPKEVETPFGALGVDVIDEAPESGVRYDHLALLKNEFSLDTFLAVLRLAADIYHVDPLLVLPLYIGMTRHPVTRSIRVAETLGDWLEAQWDADTALVTTADVVHYGSFYGSQDAEVAQEPSQSRFGGLVRDLLNQMFAQGDLEAAFLMARDVLRADHREILPLLAVVLGGGAESAVDEFSLSDYSSILNTAPPCLVASALIAYKRRNVE